jgi:hypothetical protein
MTTDIQTLESAVKIMTDDAAEIARLRAINAELLGALGYTIKNLDAAERDKLITCPAWFQVRLGEVRKLMRGAIAKAKEQPWK